MAGEEGPDCARAVVHVFQLLFEAFTEPLFHHALVIKEACTGHAFDAGEHSGIEAQSDGGGFAYV